MEELLKQLYAIRDNDTELDEYQRGVFDTLCWLIDGCSKPEVD